MLALLEKNDMVSSMILQLFQIQFEFRNRKYKHFSIGLVIIKIEFKFGNRKNKHFSIGLVIKIVAMIQNFCCCKTFIPYHVVFFFF